MKTFPIIIIIALAGCAENPNPQKNAAADHGPYPEHYEAIIHEWIRTEFFDPYSIRDLEIAKPMKGWRTGAPIFGEKSIYYGWEVVVKLNGKNRMGGYVGLQTFDVLIRDGKVIWSGNLSHPELSGMKL
jgi:hypothetical protein